MSLNTSWKSIIAERMDLVAGFVVRQLTQREICVALEHMGKVNPKNGRPWNVATINGDIKRLRQQWQESARHSMEHHQVQRLKELEAVKKAAWEQRDLDKVLRAIKQECDILGLAEPQQMILTVQHLAKKIADEEGLTVEDVMAEAQALLRELDRA